MPELPIEKLKNMTAWDTEPVFTETEIEGLLDGSSIADPDGHEPSNDDWSPTYDLNAAAAAAWLIKAGRASSLVEIDPPGSGIVTAKVFENCREMARIYSRKRRISTRTPVGS